MNCTECNSPMRKIELFTSTDWHCDECELESTNSTRITQPIKYVDPFGGVDHVQVIPYRGPSPQQTITAKREALVRQIRMMVYYKKRLHRMKQETTQWKTKNRQHLITTISGG